MLLIQATIAALTSSWPLHHAYKHTGLALSVFDLLNVQHSFNTFMWKYQAIPALHAGPTPSCHMHEEDGAYLHEIIPCITSKEQYHQQVNHQGMPLWVELLNDFMFNLRKK